MWSLYAISFHSVNNNNTGTVFKLDTVAEAELWGDRSHRIKRAKDRW